MNVANLVERRNRQRFTLYEWDVYLVVKDGVDAELDRVVWPTVDAVRSSIVAAAGLPVEQRTRP